jgi:hypothetical protein
MTFAAALCFAFGPKQTCLVAPHMSAFGGIADMTCCDANVRFLPKADIRFSAMEPVRLTLICIARR